MSTLTADRIRNHATRLGLTHLTETITQLVERAQGVKRAQGRLRALKYETRR